MFRNKDGKISSTKIGAFLIGLSAVIATVGTYLTGDLAIADAVTQLITEIGTVIAVFGVRDLPIINK